MSGIIHHLTNLARKIDDHNQHSNNAAKNESPVLRVDLDRRKILIQSREDITTALFSAQK